MLKDYYVLAKPGIVYGNALTALAGFLFGSGIHINLGRGAGMVSGISLVIAGACVCNNILDRGIDSKMQRTQNRALVTGAISTYTALLYASVLLIFGTIILAFTTNIIATLSTLLGVAMYVFVYGYAKRKTILSTIIGSISGAVPPVVGYVAATNKLDTAALVVFMIMVFWQMPHFYAISIMRRKDYVAAGLPVLAVVKSSRRVQRSIAIYIGIYAFSVVSLAAIKPVGHIYVTGMLIISIWWFTTAIQSLRTSSVHATNFAQKVFSQSLIVLLVWCVLISSAPRLANL